MDLLFYKLFTLSLNNCERGRDMLKWIFIRSPKMYFSYLGNLCSLSPLSFRPNVWCSRGRSTGRNYCYGDGRNYRYGDGQNYSCSASSVRRLSDLLLYRTNTSVFGLFNTRAWMLEPIWSAGRFLLRIWKEGRINKQDPNLKKLSRLKVIYHSSLAPNNIWSPNEANWLLLKWDGLKIILGISQNLGCPI